MFIIKYHDVNLIVLNYPDKNCYLYLNRLFDVGKLVHSRHYVVLYNMSHFFRLFKQGTVGRLFEGVKSFHGRL